jgi:hypothetical protein
MNIRDIIKRKDILEANFNKIMSIPTPSLLCEEVIKEKVARMPTTHTFGYEKVIDITPGNSIAIYPYKKILFENKALHSDRYRSRNDPSYKDSMTRTMTAARTAGLDDFVFAYLGTHEYYYAKSRGSNKPAFGLFLSASLDSDESKLPNATLYDLSSKHIMGRGLHDIILETGDARSITSHEIANIYDNDFFNYWICNDYQMKKFHDTTMWELKREFHYYDLVEIKDFTALIWPYEMVKIRHTKTSKIKGNVAQEIADFKKAYPHITIYTYEWKEFDGKERFSSASYFVIKFLYLHNRLPKTNEFEDAFIAEFPKV